MVEYVCLCYSREGMCMFPNDLRLYGESRTINCTNNTQAKEQNQCYSIFSDSLYPNRGLVCLVKTVRMPRVIINCVGWTKA